MHYNVKLLFIISMQGPSPQIQLNCVTTQQKIMFYAHGIHILFLMFLQKCNVKV